MAPPTAGDRVLLTVPPPGGAAAARGRRAVGHAEVFAALAALSFLVARFVPVLSLGFVCPLRAFTGYPCASCGMTRAFVHLAHGQVAAAVAVSPLGAVLAGGAWLLALADAARLALGLPAPRLGARATRALAVGGLAAMLANWAFLVIAHRP